MKPVFLLLFLLTISFSSLEAQAKRNKFWSNVNYELSLGAGISPHLGVYRIKSIESFVNLGVAAVYKKHRIDLGLMTFYTQYSFREAIKQTNVPSPNGQQWYVALDENGQYFINFSRWRHLFYIKYMYSVLSPKSKFDFQVGVGASLMFLFSESRESWDSISQVKAKKVRWNDSFYGLTSLHGFEKMYLNADITLFYKLSPKIKLGLGYSPIFAFDPYHYDSRIEHSIISKIYIKI